jgi:amidohydrolase
MTSVSKQKIIEYIDSQSEKLWGISNTLFREPEIAFKEYKASQILSETLESGGYKVELGIGGLETAFRAIYGHGQSHRIAILAEYDALVGLGHACGHNLIASAAVGAGLALASLQDQLNGQIQVIGTPAEEGGGGKILLIKAGLFISVDAAMMFHPADRNMVLRRSLASSRVKIDFFGKASHAAAAPEEGINALDAMILTFNNINAIRQTFAPKDRVAGVILDGGEVANIIPAHTSADFSIRSLSASRRDMLVEKVIACAQSAALSIGCRLEFQITPGYKQMLPNKTIAAVFSTNLEQLGRQVELPDINERMGSTDMGDISHIVPSIHPYLAIAPERTAGHTLEFKEYCHSDSGKLAMLDAAKALAMTAIDLLEDPGLLSKAREELSVELKSNLNN